MVAEKLGGLHSARIILYSLDFEEIRQLCRRKIEDSSRRTCVKIIARHVPLFDSTKLYAEAAVNFALAER